jgi:hypothetical protein
MSKWVIITIFMAIIIVSITTSILIVVLKRRAKDEALEDELYLKQKQDVLEQAVNAKLADNDNVVQVAASKLLSQNNNVDTVVKNSNNKLQDKILEQQKMIQSLKKMYSVEVQKIQNKDKEMSYAVSANKSLKQDMEEDNISRILDTTTPIELVDILEKRFK